MVSIKALVAVVVTLHGCLAGQLYQHTHQNVIPDEYMVVLRTGTGAIALQQIDDVIHRLTGVTVDRYVTVGKRSFIKVKGDVDKMAAIAQLSNVEFVESNQRAFLDEPVETIPPIPRQSSAGAQANAHPTCNVDPLVGVDSWGLIRTSYHASPDYQADPYMWGEGDDGTGVDIYIADTGIDLDHEDFEGRAIWGFTGADIEKPDHKDVHGHGTHVAGTAAGKMYGVARKANLIACKVLDDNGSGTFSDITLAMEYIVNRAQQQRQQGKTPRSVINMSLSGTGTAYAAETAIQAAHDEGILSVAAAGNNANDTCRQSPARIASAMTVAASNINDTLAYFSNYGPCTDIIAPGRYIMGPVANTTNSYVLKSGTSMSAPHVTGMVARHLSVLNDQTAGTLSADMLKAAMFDEASRGQIELISPEHMATPNHLLYKAHILHLY